MRLFLATAAVAALPFAALAQDEGASEETVSQIDEMLAGMNCQMDPGDIEMTEEGGYDLDDVMCEDGQYDIELDENMEEVGRRAE